ncbi:hypothetical protein ACLBXM_20070 [Xanthobacteraceae bacterium A53D]
MDLPQHVLREGYSEGVGDGRLRTPMETGPAKVRRRFLSAVRPVSVRVVLDLNQRLRLRRFWEEDTGGGSLPFYMPDQALHERPLAQEGGLLLLTETGAPLLMTSYWLVRFGERAPQFAPSELMFIADFHLEILP